MTVTVEVADWVTSTAAGEVAVIAKSDAVTTNVPDEPVWLVSPP